MQIPYHLSLGSNIDPEKNLREAVRLLGRHGDIAAASSVYETAPLGGSDQARYLNAVVLLLSELGPAEFQMQVIASIETRLGRLRTDDRYAPRTIDIDIILAGDRVTTIGHRQIPSEEILTRDFVAIPLAEIEPEGRHPVLDLPYKDIATRFDPPPGSLIPRQDIDLLEIQ